MSEVFSSNALEILNKKIRIIMNETADHVSAGGCRNMEEYSKACGVIEGLALAERELLDLNKQIEQN
jgi:hypothetical protein|tara:strand:- start:269 stop:469 length:201 start_codon:yes stop_codon:yes gene_type:complete